MNRKCLLHSPYSLLLFIGLTFPAVASPLDCYGGPPGVPKGTAEWGKGKTTNRFLTASNGQIYPCGDEIKTTKVPELIGNKNYFKRVCGPLTIVKEVAYRPCTLDERAGLDTGSGRFRTTQGQALAGATVKYLCVTKNNVTQDTSYKLRDKGGSEFSLGSSSGFFDSAGDSSSDESCTAQSKTTTSNTKYRVGRTENYITLTEVKVYGVKEIKQPSL